MNEPEMGLNSVTSDIQADLEESGGSSEHEPIIKEIVELERQYFFEKRNVKTERQRKLREIIERRVRPGGQGDDT